MIRSVVGGALRFRGLVLGIAAAILVVGVVTLPDAPTDVYPEFTPAYVEIQTESLGLSAPEVEQLLTVPLEADLLNGVEGVEVLRSSSLPGLSSIVLVFEQGFDLYKGRQLIQERLTQLGGAAFPNVSKPPTMLPPLSSSSRVLMIGLSSKELSGIDKSVLARWTVRPRLMGVEGVANVSIWGMRDQQIQVQVDPKRLADRDVTLQQVVATAGNAQVASPVSYLEASVPGTGGFIETPQQRLGVRSVFDNIATPAQLGRVPVEGTSGRLRLTDVADVVEDHQPLIGDAVVGDDEGLLLVVEKFPGADVEAVTKGVEDALDELKPGLAGVKTDTTVFRPATFIADATDNLTLTLLIGAALLALALVAFLRQWRVVLIALVTIPVSLVAAALVLDAMGETFNAISIVGLAIALVVVIDDAVAGSEAIARRLREAPDGASTASVVLDATHGIRRPLAYASLITLLAIMPLAVMEGRPGDFFGPLVLAYALAVVAALVTALTLTPALGALLPARRGPAPLARIGAVYGGVLSRLLGRPVVVLGAVAACGVSALVALLLMNASPVPTLEDRNVIVGLTSKPGTSQPRMTKIATNVTRALRAIDGVDNVGAHVGRAVGGDKLVDVNSAEVVVGVDSDADYDSTMASIRNVADGVEGAEADVLTYSAQRVRDVGALDEGQNPAAGSDNLEVLTGTGSPIAVRLYGQDPATLEQEAAKLKGIVAGVDGVVDPRIEKPATQPTLEIKVDVDKARRYGVKPGDVRRAAAIMVQGILVGSVFQEQRVFDVIVQGTDDLRTDQKALGNLLIDRPGGGQVRLSELADVRIGSSPTVIKRDAVSRKLDIEMGVSGRSVSAVADDLEQRLADVDLPLEYHAEVLDNTVADEINDGQILAFALAVVVAIFLLLQAAFRSWRMAAVVFVTLPSALLGGVVGVLLLGDGLTLGAMAALLALFALAARNGLTMIDHLLRLERGGERQVDPRLVQQGARERLAATLASAAGIGAVMVPMVVMGSGAGLEIVNPLAVVVLCGLVTTSAVSLFALPVLHLQLWSGKQPVAEEADGAVRAEPTRAAR